jgi:hypothetical protein
MLTGITMCVEGAVSSCFGAQHLAGAVFFNQSALLPNHALIDNFSS